jgi:hypothetical protein
VGDPSGRKGAIKTSGVGGCSKRHRKSLGWQEAVFVQGAISLSNWPTEGTKQTVVLAILVVDIGRSSNSRSFLAEKSTPLRCCQPKPAAVPQARRRSGPSVFNSHPIAAGSVGPTPQQAEPHRLKHHQGQLQTTQQLDNRRTGLPTQSTWQRGSRCRCFPRLHQPQSALADANWAGWGN